MEDDDSIVYSPLRQTVTRDGVSVRVNIYRGREEARWVLDIVDERGGSTIWDDQFATDQQALDEALAAIESDGIESFLMPVVTPSGG